ncbi:uncharacterized protein DUF1648 [Roseimicrobium gellanilyticum]|uniref:Uncharacterized protein DUF1648 n=1 Tax=Roseimicrobium gellanilyticum TaxID=748857 RepID=A0A366HP87_9BACT|nr:DUF1648 domain-containing protein [Roseimicrobium gellanilyticum]RBP44395.1 uncharacterized protein DUF1648 [Roseimicrobium gellanilyticum]
MMKKESITLPGTCFILSLVVFLAYVWLSGDRLPERVATHFKTNGTADAWMDRHEHLWSMTAAGIGLPMLIVGAFLIVRKVPARFVNLPYREYWLAEERRPMTMAWMTRAALWLGCGITLGMGVLYELILRANALTPATLESGPVMLVVAIMMGSTVIFVIATVLHFYRPPTA